MKKLSKVLSIVVISLMLLTIASNFVLAVDPSTIKGDTKNTTSITNVGKQIIGIIQVVGSVVAVGVLVVLGIKYMMGSTEEKAEYKKTLVPYIIGAVLIFAASNLAGMVYTWANSVTK